MLFPTTGGWTWTQAKSKLGGRSGEVGLIYRTICSRAVAGLTIAIAL